jgi:hypothetical protein
MVIYDAAPEVIEAAWLEEAKWRLEEVRAGRMKTVASHEVERRLWVMVQRGCSTART